ncbi:hypothetical protein G9A89_011404 [Geosiphon pyriformis]|nr:hypothetical protein G9A89_011404 [Geosiphon pyriformis]
MATPYITRLTDFSEEKKEMDMHMWLREAQKAIQANNWNDQRAIQMLSFFLKGTADLWYQSLETKLMSFAKFKDAFLEYFSDSNVMIQLQNKFNTIKQGLKSSILGRVCPAHSNSLPEAVMLTRALELAEKKANHS